MKTKVYITKYALTKGVYEAEGIVYDDGSVAIPRERGFGHAFFHKRHFVTTPAAVKVRVAEMLEAGYKKLKRAKAKLDAINSKGPAIKPFDY